MKKSELTKLIKESYKEILLEETNLSTSDIKYFQNLIDSLQYECDKAKETNGEFSYSYVKEKLDNIDRLLKPYR
jgi:hypothetical protein